MAGWVTKKCDLNIAVNNNNHHTEEISTERLVVRRGQPFTITVSFTRLMCVEKNLIWSTEPLAYT
uniref:Transglutaminase N-terminal domain-containing protein n=1 Tax=Apteryx owenii TaxID=8824 RepID=A0A8B9P7Z2_APTOW